MIHNSNRAFLFNMTSLKVNQAPGIQRITTMLHEFSRHFITIPRRVNAIYNPLG